MLVRFRPRLTYANVMVTVLAFIVLGGGAYAAVKLPKNSVGTKQLKKKAVTTAKIKNQAVKPPKLADGAVTVAKLAPGVAISGPQGPQGPEGPEGPPGPAGSAVGYAFVDADGSFDPARSKNLVASVVTATNIYCLEFTTAPRNVVVTLDSSTPGYATATVNANSLETNCEFVNPAANVLVLTINTSSMGQARDFYVAVN